MESSSQHDVGNGDRTLVIMAKAPTPGLVKTRLTSRLPVQAVTAFYRCLLDDTLALARSLGSVQVAIMCPESDVKELTELAGHGVRVVAQQGEGLAAGLTSVFAHFTKDHPRRVYCLQQRQSTFAAFCSGRRVRNARRTRRGGRTNTRWRLLSGRGEDRHPLFGGDGMGTSSALERLLLRARVLGLSVGFADPFYDIDVADDLTRLAAELRLAPALAPRTAAWLKEWELVGDNHRQARENCEAQSREESVRTRGHVVRGANHLLTQLRRQGWTVLHGLFDACGYRVPSGDPRVFRYAKIFPTRCRHWARPGCCVAH